MPQTLPPSSLPLSGPGTGGLVAPSVPLTTWRPWPLIWLALAVILAGAALLLGRSHAWLAWLSFVGIGLAALCAGREILALRRAARSHELAMEGAHDGMWSWNPVSKELQVGTRLLSILGYGDNFLPDTHAWLALVHPEDAPRYNRAVAEHLKGNTPHFYCEYRVRAKSGEYRWIASRGIAVRDHNGIATLMAGSVTDITERKLNEERMLYLAHHDQLTGLPNRLLLADRLPQTLGRAQRANGRAAVLFVDLDRFKNINDSLGHTLGDRLLQTVARRLQEVLRQSDTIVRQGGDEFIVILGDLKNAEQAGQVGAKVLEILARPYREGSYDFFLTASIGIALYPEDGNDMEALLRNADTAMYEGKSSGGNTVRFYSGHMNERLQHRVSLENRLRRAMEQQQFELYYQPQLSLTDGRLVGAEALLRWREDGSLIPPDQFIPVAEETGLIVPLGHWVLRTAIAQAAAWQRIWQAAGETPPRIAINLSARQFWGGGIARQVLDLLGKEGLRPEAIELEVTESVLLRQEADSVEELRRLREAGVPLALDDFGTGYSSLSYLRLLPIETLKIDKSFISALDDEVQGEEAEAIVRAILAMAHTLELSVVAEGVEHPGQLRMLQDMDCDLYQGYLESRPLPAEEFLGRYAPGNSNTADQK